MATLSLFELKKRTGRIEIFLNKLANSEEFETTGGKFQADQLYHYKNKIIQKIFTPKNKSEFISAQNILNKADRSDSFLIAHSKKKTPAIPITKLVKTNEFGGKGAGGSLQAEERAIGQMREAIEEAIKQNKGPISIKVGSTTIKNIVGVEKTSGTPKSDFHLLNTQGDAVIWISHKDGSGPKDFQQWGGISQRSEPTIFNHPETQKFVEDLKIVYPDGLPRATTLYRKIKDKKLKMLSVYGNQYTSNKLGAQNVSVLLQGPVGIKGSGNFYTFTANHVHFNGDSVDSGGFEPVLMAIYKGDRSDAGVKGTRIVISPISGRKGTEFAEVE